MLERSLTYLLSSIAEDGIGNANHIFEVRFGWSVRELRVLRLIRGHTGGDLYGSRRDDEVRAEADVPHSVEAYQSWLVTPQQQIPGCSGNSR